MLVRLTDIKEKVYWINPVHVKVVTEGKKGVTLVCLKHDLAWGNTVAAIKTAMPVDEVAALLNLGMPDGLLGYPPGGDDEPEDDAGNAAMATTIIG